MSRLGTGTMYKCDGCANEYFETEGLRTFLGGARNRGYTVTYRDRHRRIRAQIQELWFCSIGCLLAWALGHTEDANFPISLQQSSGRDDCGTINDADDWRKVKVSDE